MSARSDFGPRRAKRLLTVFEWPVLWGAGLTFLFYALLPYLPIHRELAVRYFCGHPIEYATTVLFFVGMSLIAKKAVNVTREKRALRYVLATKLETGSIRSQKSPSELLTALPAGLLDSAIGERLTDAADHLESKQSTPLGDHLKYLAELAAERLHGSYALVRTICWAIPILGFLGTVMGITLAIANINPEQLSGSLSDVTGGLAIAFDTTALALALSLVLVFSTFVVERSEQAVLDSIESFALKQLAPLGNAVSNSPFVQAEIDAANQLVHRTDLLIRSQTEAWSGAIDSMRQRWAETILEQQGQLRETLSAGVEMTLADHAAGLKAAREDLVSAVTQCTDRLDRTLNETNRERARQLETFSADLRSLWDRCRGDLDDMQDRYQETLASTVANVGSDLRSWGDELRESSSLARDQQKELGRQTEILLRVADQSSDLANLESRLSDNLESLRATETLQEAVHSLSAAAHLLTARATPRSRAA